MNSPRALDETSGLIVDAAFKLHAALGPGLLELAYDSLLARALQARGLKVHRQKVVSFRYEGTFVPNALRLDMLVDDQVVVEVKSLDAVLPVHTKQVLTYLRVLDLRLGLLINFGGATLREGIRRVVNGYKPPHYAGRLEIPNDANAGSEENPSPRLS